MAKIRPYYRSKSGKSRSVAAGVTVQRTSERGANSFYACARVGKYAYPTATARSECAYGKNPRAAMGKALKGLGAKLSRQKGAFAGLK